MQRHLKCEETLNTFKFLTFYNSLPGPGWCLKLDSLENIIVNLICSSTELPLTRHQHSLRPNWLLRRSTASLPPREQIIQKFTERIFVLFCFDTSLIYVKSIQALGDPSGFFLLRSFGDKIVILVHLTTLCEKLNVLVIPVHRQHCDYTQQMSLWLSLPSGLRTVNCGIVRYCWFHFILQSTPNCSFWN